MSNHRYWRVKVLNPATKTYTPSCAELQMFDTVGGSNLCTGGTASASSYYGYPYVPGKAFDGDTSTFWNANGYENEWLAYDRGEGNECDIIQISWTARNDSYASSQCPVDCVVEYSDNGSSWTDSWFITDYSSWSAGQTKTWTKTASFDIAAAHRYWRYLIVSTAQANSASFCETQMRITAGGSNQLGSGTASTNDYYGSGYEASKGCDGNTGTLWGTSASSPYWWWTYDFGYGATKKIVETTITSRNSDPWYQQTPSNFFVQTSDDDDGIIWFTVNSFTTSWTSAAQTQTFTVQSSGGEGSGTSTGGLFFAHG